MSQIYTPQTLPSNVIRQFLIPLAEEFLEEYVGGADLFDMIEEFSWGVGQHIFGGGYFEDEDETDATNYYGALLEIYEEKFKPFLDKHKLDQVDMYLYMRGVMEADGDLYMANDDEKHIIMSHYLSKQLDDLGYSVFDLNQTANSVWILPNEIGGGGIHKVQALWRGYNSRWENPFFTFKD